MRELVCRGPVSGLPRPESGTPRSRTEMLTSVCEKNDVPSAFRFPSAGWRCTLCGRQKRQKEILTEINSKMC